MTSVRARAGFAAALAGALVLALLVPTYPNYDSYFHLVWGEQLLRGSEPAFEAYAAPTEHPLFLGLTTLLDLVFGGWADRALVLVCVGALVALVFAVLRVGRACFGPWEGALGALFVGSSFGFLLYAARGYVDIPFLAVVLWAAAWEAERPRRGWPVLALLAVAGLLRPEAWVLAGAYWLWLAWSGRSARAVAPLLGWVLLAPVVWALVDLVVTGDPLFSLHATSKLADALGRERGLAKVPRAFVSFLSDTARPPVFLAGLLGLALLVVRLAGRGPARVRALAARPRVQAPHVPLALFATGVATFVGSGAAGLSILPRYLTVPVVALCLLAGFAVMALGRRFAVAAAVLGLAFLVVKLGSFGTLWRELRFIRQTHEDVAALAADPRVLRCGPITMPTYRLVPDLAFELDDPDVTVTSRGLLGAAHPGLAVFVVGSEKAVKRFGEADGVPRATNRGLDRGRVVIRHGFLWVEDRCGGLPPGPPSTPSA